LNYIQIQTLYEYKVTLNKNPNLFSNSNSYLTQPANYLRPAHLSLVCSPTSWPTGGPIKSAQHHSRLAQLALLPFSLCPTGPTRHPALFLFLPPLVRTARVRRACAGAMGRSAPVSSALARTRVSAREPHSLAPRLAASLAPADSRHAASPSRDAIASVGHGNRTTPASEP
jgi:hypothetical protein